ncbi:hypothetical protein IFM89_025201 [Coptis chinensis]|uniref:Metallothionein-like protein n=1 Tax=Coptis chinensis TaxID=261450 RepID=A0A835I1G8_9MAGN|nr:hypothetical protein IFM89_025201 [Coptis chinensis]
MKYSQSKPSKFIYPIYLQSSSKFTMSNTCGNCDCADKTQCPKKGNSYGLVIIETGKSIAISKLTKSLAGLNSLVLRFVHSSYDAVAEVPAGENDGKCKCGANCACTDCKCGH